MKVGIIGGGIAGLSAAYYIKKFGVPVSKIVLLESSNRFGGWIESKKFIDETSNRQVIFDSGPRTLRYSSANKELNTLSMALDLKLEDQIDLIRTTHPASTKRYIYLNGKVNLIKPSLFFNDVVLGKPLLLTLFKEYRTPPRSSDIQDESIYDFITRRFNSTIAENVVDPVIKGICGGDIKDLSAASLLQNIYDSELKSGSVVRSMIIGNRTFDKQISKNPYEDLSALKEKFAGTSVWRFKSGMQTFSDTLVKYLQTFDDIELKDNEKCLEIDIKSESNHIEVKTSRNKYDFDYVISSVYSKHLANFLTDDHILLKNMLNKIPAVNMVVVNLYFDKNILPVEGFGYLVPSKENSPILGCIFDSIFDKENKDHSTLTVMMGGALYEKYIGKEDDHEKLLNMALDTLKKQLNFNLQPKKYQVSIMKDAIPQYRVGHKSLLNDIFNYLKNNNLDEKLYLVGNSYNGFGINDIIFNSRNLCQINLKNRIISTESSS